MENTVTLARQEQEKQGEWEVEVSYGGEADLHRHLARCKRNPGHQNFIPVDQFNAEHFPPGCHDNQLVDLVRAVSDLTVRVSVKYVSDSRPETVPGSDKPYPCYKDRGMDMLRTGTGLVIGVDTIPGEVGESNETCYCKKCVNSPTPKTHFARIDIQTAAHVVYDDLEAFHTKCHLFFDKGKSPDVCSGVVTLSGVSLAWCGLDGDCCCLRYMIHDLDLAERLKKSLTHYKLYASITHTSKPSRSNGVDRSYVQWSPRFIKCHNDSDKAETFIVSHPHGCSKQVSFGRCTHVKNSKDDATTYSTPTCPGSSGARVCVMGKDFSSSMFVGYVHSGGKGKGRGQLNFSVHGHYVI